MPAKKKANSKKHLKRSKSLKKVKPLTTDHFFNPGPGGGSAGGTGSNLGPVPVSPGMGGKLP